MTTLSARMTSGDDFECVNGYEL